MASSNSTEKKPAKLVVMIPAYNEAGTIAEVIAAVPRKISGVEKVEVLVVDDGSTDATAETARRAGADKVISHNRNLGLGVAFRTGIENALRMGADMIVNIDADMQFNPADIPAVIAPVLSGRADVCTCSRFLDKALEPEMPWIKKFGNRLFTSLINMLTGQKFTDTQCGFRAYSREAMLRLSLFGRFTYTQEALLNLANKGFRIEEVACRVKGERKGKSRVVRHWYSYGIKALLIIIRAIRDYHPLKFFGGIGMALLLLGGISGLALLIRLLIKHQVDPYTWVAYADVILIVVGFILLVLALLADMSDRQRKLLEEMLYRQRKAELEVKK